MIINFIRAQYSKLVAVLLVRFAPTSAQTKARYKSHLEAVAASSFKKGTQLDRRILKLEALIEQLEAEADRLSDLADGANLMNFRANALIRSI